MQSASASPALSNVAEESDLTPSGIDDGGGEKNYIEKSALLDIAFLHSVASHRPIGPHKHFNVIPILINLDRTARQVGARMRDDSFMMGVIGGDEDGGEGSRSRSIKREEGVEQDELVVDQASSSSTMVPIDSAMIWQRLNQLYDVGGLEDLENQALDNDVNSPFRNAYSHQRRRSHIQGLVPSFGYGSGGLEKKKKPTTKTGGRTSNSKKAEEEEILYKSGDVEFELGPWEEFDELIAPRRLKSFAPDEDGHSESDGELTEPSEADEEQAVEEAEEEEIEGGSEEEEEEGEEGEEEVEEDEDDGEDEPNNKRKASNKRGGSTSSKKSKQATPASRGTRNSTKPRRSARR